MTLRRPSPRRLQPHDPHHRHIRLPGDPEAENCEETPSHLSCLFRRVLCTDDRGSAPRQTLPRGRDKQMNKLMTLKERAREADDDCELLARYQQYDDEEALATIHSRHVKDLQDYARRELGVGSGHDAEEIVQQTFLHFHRCRKRYPSQTCVRALLFKMVHDACADHLEHVEAQKRDRRLRHRLRASQADPKADFAKQESKMLVDELLDTLTPEQAKAVRLVRIEGHTAESAAELLGQSKRTVRRRIKEAFVSLRSR
jgi:RNA polymerase sigma factor (sigma-70 family)